jgi:hypothetical protein
MVHLAMSSNSHALWKVLWKTRDEFIHYINKGKWASRLGAVEFPVGIAVVAPKAGIDNINLNVKVAPVDG